MYKLRDNEYVYFWNDNFFCIVKMKGNIPIYDISFYKKENIKISSNKFTNENYKNFNISIDNNCLLYKELKQLLQNKKQVILSKNNNNFISLKDLNNILEFHFNLSNIDKLIPITKNLDIFDLCVNKLNNKKCLSI